MSIPELFAAFGEQGFRELENQTLQEAAIANDAIIATGGGAPCFFDNMEWMNKNGITVFIDTPVKVLADRLINARVERPLVKGKSYEELIAFIETKLEERRPFYNQAQIILKGVDLSADDLIEALGS
jgi:shikimate kinase